jgi:hypothetical protein
MADSDLEKEGDRPGDLAGEWAVRWADYPAPVMPVPSVSYSWLSMGD